MRSGTPEERQAKRRAYDAKPENIARRRAYQLEPANKTKAKSRRELKKQEVGYWAERLARQRHRRTGFSAEVVAALLVLQDGKCAVCSREFQGRQMRADHDHDSGKPRGLLCHPCNIAEGLLRGMGLAPEEFAVRLGHYLTSPPALKLAP